MQNMLERDALTDNLTQTGRIIAIDTALGPDTLLLTSVKGEDRLSNCAVYTVEFITKAADSEIRSLIGQNVTIWLHNDDVERRRPINGHIRRIIDRPNKGTGLNLYRAEIVPKLWFLDCTSDCRIFQDMTFPAIVAEVLQEYGVSNVQFKLVAWDYPVAEYCVQYRESALAFVSRLMEHVGIFYFHEHTATSHTLVITDRNQFAEYMSPAELEITHKSQYGTIQSVATDTAFRPGAWSLSDYDFQGPTKFLQQNVQSALDVSTMLQHERFDFPGGYTEQRVGLWLTQMRMEEEEAQFNRMLGTAHETGMLPGYRFKFDRFDTGAPTTYLLTEVRHSAQESSYFNMAERIPSAYSNEFVAIDAAVPFRPQRVTPKSVMRGSQTATVVSANANDPIQVDEYARIKVHFHWDRRGDPNAGNTSCWVRVSQNSAGAGFGAVSIPHAGQEVVVDFLEGDPDRPLIVGRVHNSDKMPPYDVPAHKNKTITRDHGGNKFVMDGESGGRHMTMMVPGNLNMFALGKAAQPLSSQSTSSANYSLPDIILDPNPSGYSDLKTALAAAYAVDASTAAAPASGKDKSGLIETADNNSITEGNYNSFKKNNNNSWTMGFSFTYTHLGTLSITELDATSVVLGANTSGVLGFDTKAVVGFSTSFILGFSTSFTLLSSVSFVGKYALSKVYGSDNKWVGNGSTTYIAGPIIKYNKGPMLDYRWGNILDMRNGSSMEWKRAKVELVAAGTLTELELTFDQIQQLLISDPLLADPTKVLVDVTPAFLSIDAAKTAAKIKTDAAATKASLDLDALITTRSNLDKMVQGSQSISVGVDWNLIVGTEPAVFQGAIDATVLAAAATNEARADQETLNWLAAFGGVDPTPYAGPDGGAIASAAASALNSGAAIGTASIKATGVDGSITMNALLNITVAAVAEASFSGLVATKIGLPDGPLTMSGAMVSVTGDVIMIG